MHGDAARTQAGMPNPCQMSELSFGARSVLNSCRHCHELAAEVPASLCSVALLFVHGAGKESVDP